MKPKSSFSIADRIESFAHAFRGLCLLIATQDNARIHGVAAILVVGCGLFFKISPLEWCVLLLCIGLVFVTEAMNTAIEFLADEVSLEIRERIGAAKDTAAAAVLIASMVAVLCGGFIFLPRISQIFSQ